MNKSSSNSSPTLEALHALSRQDDADALKVLTEAAMAEDQFVRRSAIEVIGKHPQGQSLRAVVLAALTDPSEYVVRTACDVVGCWKLSEAHDGVHRLLTDGAVATRASAVRALDAIWKESDFSAIYNMYVKDAAVKVRRECAWVLQNHPAVVNWRTLFDAFHADALPRHRQWACELAARFSGREVLPSLTKLADDPDGHVRMAAARAISIMGERGSA